MEHLEPTFTRSQLAPPLKWAGGKRWLVPTIKQYYAKHRYRRFVELFCGGLAVSLELQPATVLANDINPHLINFYNKIKSGELTKLPFGSKIDFVEYYSNRKRFNKLLNSNEHQSVEAAQLFYYLNRTCYNGLCRFNKRGEFNTPIGRYSKVVFLSDFSKHQRQFSSWIFTSSDFSLALVKDEDFIYCDPPYDHTFTKYTSRDFNWEDQLRLVMWATKHKGPLMISNAATDRIISLYTNAKFNIIEVLGPSLISCSGNRTSRREILAYKNI